MTDSVDSQAYRWMTKGSQGLALASMGIAVLVLVGWVTGLEILKSAIPGRVAMNPVTALMFIVSSFSLLVLAGRKAAGWGRAGQVASAIVGLFALGKICEYFGWGLRFDQAFFSQAVSSSANQMAPNTAFCFLLSAFASLLFFSRLSRGPLVAQGLIFLVGGISFQAILGYILNAEFLYGFRAFIPMAFHTAVCFLVISIGLLLARPEQALMEPISRHLLGGRMARRTLPFTLIVPVLLAWLRIEGEQRGLYGTEFGTSLLTTATVAILTAVVWWNAAILNKADEAARTNETFLNSIVENLPTMLFVKDAKDLKFVQLNRAGEAILGQKREALLGKSDMDFFPEAEARHFIATDRSVLSSGKLLDVGEESIHTKDKGVRVLHTRKIPILDSAGTPRFLLGISEDITEQKDLLKELSFLNVQLKVQMAELETVNRELESFSYSVSHDLRAPLRSIAGFSKILIEDHGASLNEEANDNLRRMNLAAQRMGQLIDGLLNLSRITRREIRKEPVSLSALAETVAGELRDSHPEHSVIFTAASDISAQCDAQLISVVLTNLLGNAWKFTTKQSIPRVDFGQEETSRGLAYFVRDNGAGFDMRYADKLFGAFQRLHSPSEFEGTGIGLATVQRVISRHGGSIWAESAVGRGTTFYFTL